MEEMNMKILRQPIISCEFFPPKTHEGMQHLGDVAAALAGYHPQFFSVTFGAGGSTREGTIETVKFLQDRVRVRIAPHLACIGATYREILEILHHYKMMGVKRIVALRGDPPSGMVGLGDFKYASELVSLIRQATGDFFHIEVAAYPEIHPQAKNVAEDILNLKRKYEAGADSAITQYFFNPDAYFYFVDECTKLGIHMSIVPGIMPITQFNKLARFSDACGSEIPRWIRKRLESYGDDLESIKAFGLEIVYNLCQRLITGGAPGLHFYTLNKAGTTIEIIQMLGLGGIDQKKSVSA